MILERSISMCVLPSACAGSSLFLMTSTAMACDMALGPVEQQPGLPQASMNVLNDALDLTDVQLLPHLSVSHSFNPAAELAELQLLPHLDVSPWQVLTFLLQHPLITAGTAAALAFLIPRLVRAGIRFVVVPAAVALALYVVSLNPSGAVNLARGAFDSAIWPTSTCSERTPHHCTHAGMILHASLHAILCTWIIARRSPAVQVEIVGP